HKPEIERFIGTLYSDPTARRPFVRCLARGLMGLAAVPDLNGSLDDLLADKRFMKAIGFGWEIHDEESLKKTETVMDLLQTLSEIDAPANRETRLNMIRFLSAAAQKPGGLEIIDRQVRQLLSLRHANGMLKGAALLYLSQWCRAFDERKVELEDLVHASNAPGLQ
ncbi:MAG: hypothetical protein HQL18_01590, partial [Candidatus Omnitrophica bacterium]|nr:hypothetical protein [Candidatus Omnitrophota bacterium]